MKKIISPGSKLHWIRNLYLRYKNGGGCCDIYSLDYYLAKRIIKPLKAYRKATLIGCPGNLNSLKEWNMILDEMIWAFEFIVNNELTVMPDGSEEYYNRIDHEKMQKGLELFGTYFRNLWI